MRDSKSRKQNKLNKPSPHGKQSLCFCLPNLGVLVRLQAPETRNPPNCVPFLVHMAAEFLCPLIPSDMKFHNLVDSYPCGSRKNRPGDAFQLPNSHKSVEATMLVYKPPQHSLYSHSFSGTGFTLW